LAAGTFGCAGGNDKPVMYGIEGRGSGSPPPLYGVEGNRTATVPAVNAAAGTGDHLPSDNFSRMGPAAYNGAGSSERPMPSEPNVPGGRTAPVNAAVAAPAGSGVAPGTIVNSTDVTVPSSTAGRNAAGGTNAA